jgi:hypothetical protein
MVGHSYVGITSGSLVTRPQSRDFSLSRDNTARLSSFYVELSHLYNLYEIAAGIVSARRRTYLVRIKGRYDFRRKSRTRTSRNHRPPHTRQANTKAKTTLNQLASART